MSTVIPVSGDGFQPYDVIIGRGLLPELGRNFSEYRMLLFGAAMVLIMVWKPGGLLSAREPTVRLAKAQNEGARP